MSKKKKRIIPTDGIVFSTDSHYEFEEFSSDETTLPPRQQTLRISLRRLKGGKKATIVYDFQGAEDDFKELGKHLKSKCGVGGSVKDGEIILQGDMRPKVTSELTSMGYKFKMVGG